MTFLPVQPQVTLTRSCPCHGQEVSDVTDVKVKARAAPSVLAATWRKGKAKAKAKALPKGPKAEAAKETDEIKKRAQCQGLHYCLRSLFKANCKAKETVIKCKPIYKDFVTTVCLKAAFIAKQEPPIHHLKLLETEAKEWAQMKEDEEIRATKTMWKSSAVLPTTRIVNLAGELWLGHGNPDDHEPKALQRLLKVV